MIAILQIASYGVIISLDRWGIPWWGEGSWHDTNGIEGVDNDPLCEEWCIRVRRHEARRLGWEHAQRILREYQVSK